MLRAPAREMQTSPPPRRHDALRLLGSLRVLAAGGGDGIHRLLSNRRGCVLVRGKLVPIVGIISMDVTMIDVTDVPGIEIGDVVTIYGTDGEHVHPANAVARSIGTVTSDLLCAVAQRVPRVYV